MCCGQVTLRCLLRKGSEQQAGSSQHPPQRALPLAFASMSVSGRLRLLPHCPQHRAAQGLSAHAPRPATICPWSPHGSSRVVAILEEKPKFLLSFFSFEKEGRPRPASPLVRSLPARRGSRALRLGRAAPLWPLWQERCCRWPGRSTLLSLSQAEALASGLVTMAARQSQGPKNRSLCLLHRGSGPLKRCKAKCVPWASPGGAERGSDSCPCAPGLTDLPRSHSARCPLVS